MLAVAKSTALGDSTAHGGLSSGSRYPLAILPDSRHVSRPSLTTIDVTTYRDLELIISTESCTAMPSLFHRHRRGSENTPNARKDGVQAPQARRSTEQHDAVHGTPLNHDVDEVWVGKREKGRVGSLSQLLHRKPEIHEVSPPPTTPPQPVTSLVDDAPITTRPRAASQLVPEAAIFSQNSVLSATTSPEGNGNGHRRSGSWEPSYPVVLPSALFAKVNGKEPPSNPIGSYPFPSENAHRRSLGANAQLTPGPEDLATFPVLTPNSPPATEPSPLPTISQFSASNEDPHALDNDSEQTPASDTLVDRVAPVDEAATITGIVPPEAEPSTRPLPPPTFISIPPFEPSSPIASSPTVHTSSPVSPTATLSCPSSPTTAKAHSRSVILSPPMPQPIRNLPSMVGWPTFMKDGNPVTPGWGTLAKEGGPKTPGWTTGARTPGWSMMSPGSSRPTSSSGGFPFALPQTPIGLNKGKDRDDLSEVESRKARRSMPVMLREPSFMPQDDEDDGAVGASDDEGDDDSETGMDGQPFEDDSEDETETEAPIASSSTPSKLPSMAMLSSLKGKETKAKGNGKNRRKDSSGRVAGSALASTAVAEEEPPAPTTSADPKASTTKSPGMRLDLNKDLQKGKMFWSLPTPRAKQKQQGGSTSWTQFASPSPSSTPGPGSVSAQPTGPPAAGRNDPNTSGSIASFGSYFESQPGSSTASDIGTPSNQEPVLARLGSKSDQPIQPGKGEADVGPAPLTEVTTEGSGPVVAAVVALPPVQDPAPPQEVAAASPSPTTSALLSGLGLGPTFEKSQDTARPSVVSERMVDAMSPVVEEPNPIEQYDPAIMEEVIGDEGDQSDDESGDETSLETSSQSHVANSPLTPESSRESGAPPFPAGPKPADIIPRPELYTRVSRSMVNLPPAESQTSKVSASPQLATIPSRAAAPGKIELPSRTPVTPVTAQSPGGANQWAEPPPTPLDGPRSFFWQNKDGRQIGVLKRRRSDGDTSIQPPQYEPPHPGVVIPRPREEEGKEKLPAYWCAVHIEGYLLRKMEFSEAGKQSKDRSWKRYYFIVSGTALYVYRSDPHRFPVKDESVPVPFATEEEAEEFLHVHWPGERRPSVSTILPSSAVQSSTGRRSSGPEGVGIRRPSAGATSTERRRRGSVASLKNNSNNLPAVNIPGRLSAGGQEKDLSMFSSSGKTPSQRRSSVSTTSSVGSTVGPSSLVSHFQHNQIVKQYTLQKAESGLAADYLKRKNVVRVRAEGEQFLLQTENAKEVVHWIEAFQAASNVALDLDERPMPKIITLPRRRRRRIVANAAGAGESGTATARTQAEDTPEANVAAVQAAERAHRERERMLEEDQAAQT